jgi:phage gpG-like protein
MIPNKESPARVFLGLNDADEQAVLDMVTDFYSAS